MANSPNKLQDNNTAVTSNSETVASLTEVTSSSPTQSSNAAFQPFQQLHEAVLAAVNSNGMPISHHSFFAAAAAVAAATNANALPTHPQIKTEIDIAKKESIRASNRERKKKWRIHNEERNKDNDLRCRVNKRANKLFGNDDSPAKQNWVKEEFEKRRQKRIDKERRKMIVNNALSVPPTTNTTTVIAPEDHGMSNIVTHAQLPSFYTPLPQIDNAAAAKLLDFPADLQRQLLEQLNNSMLALTNGIQQTASKVEEIKQEVINDVNNQQQQSISSPSSSTIAEVHLPTSTMITNDSSIALSTTNTTNTTTSNTLLSSSDQVSDMEIDTDPTCNNNNNNSNNNSNDNNNNTHGTPVTEEEDNKENNSCNKMIEDEENQTKDSHQGNDENKPEYPMDTVLTLMQLNAGWKQ